MAPNQPKTRQERLASKIELPPNRFEMTIKSFFSRSALWRLGVGLLGAFLLAVLIQAWNPPMYFRAGQVPQRIISARVKFSLENPDKTLTNRNEAANKVRCVYSNNPEAVRLLASELENNLRILAEGPDFVKEDKQLLLNFFPAEEQSKLTNVELKHYQKLIYHFLGTEEKRELFKKTLNETLSQVYKDGLLEALPSQGNKSEIRVYQGDDKESIHPVEVKNALLIKGVNNALRERFDKSMELFVQEVDAMQPKNTPPAAKPPTAKPPVAAPPAPAPEGTPNKKVPRTPRSKGVSAASEGTADPVEPVTTSLATTSEEIIVAPPTPPTPPAAGTQETTSPPPVPPKEDPQPPVAKPLENQKTLPELLSYWLFSRLKGVSTLVESEMTNLEIKKARDNAKLGYNDFKKGETIFDLDKGSVAITEKDMPRLKAEHLAYLETRTSTENWIRLFSVTLMFFFVITLCGVYTHFRLPKLFKSPARLLTYLGTSIVPVLVAYLLSAQLSHSQLLILIVYGMALAIAYNVEFAVLSIAAVTLLMSISLGFDLGSYVIFVGTAVAGLTSVTQIRSRTKLIYAGFRSAAVTIVLSLLVWLIASQPSLGNTAELLAIYGNAAFVYACWAIASGFLMSGILPWVEKWADVLTDLSLFELGDVAHPLLQELAVRAPSTYSHSQTVGTIAETAAREIGARGLLCRVGAYFHDIGKMLVPTYFIENQPSDVQSKHETLEPAMSSLVIVAHVKDGVDLAKQNGLPLPIIDLIEQHHGTTKVGFFYEKAKLQQQSKTNPDAQSEAERIDEQSYRYPGPKPQTKEAAILLLADNAESASRTLIDPTQKKIASMVQKILNDRLDGGQFDESGITIQELRNVERSFVKSLTSLYHGRIKYPQSEEEQK